MTRIVAGRARGRRLQVPPGTGTRPTSDRVREALFSSLDATLGNFQGIRVLDLYAGSGGLGLEALSRGAAHVLLVESNAAAVRAIQANVTQVGLPGAEILRLPVERALASAPDVPYHLVLADPPYALDARRLTGVLQALARGWLAAAARVVVERDVRGEPLIWPEGLVAERQRRYGETMLWYGRSAS